MGRASIIKRTIKRWLLRSRLVDTMYKAGQGNYVIMCHDVPRRNAEKFEAALRFLSSRFTIVSLSTLVQQIQEAGRRKPTGLLALTFDDGLCNQYEVVYPILKRMSLPATYYVCPGLAETGDLAWTWEMGIRLGRLSSEEQRRLGRSRQSIVEIVDWMKTISFEARTRIQDEIIDCDPGFEFQQSEIEQYASMTWDQIGKLDSNLITVGSHTYSHMNLPQASDSQLDFELRETREQLEQTVGRPVVHFCYPDGIYDRRTLRAVSSHYESAVTTKMGVVRAGDDILQLPRIHLQLDVPEFAYSLAMNSFNAAPRPLQIRDFTDTPEFITQKG